MSLPIDFNGVHYIYLNPEVSLATVEQARDHYLATGSNYSLFYKKDIPANFRWKIYWTQNSNLVTSSTYIDSNVKQSLTTSNEYERLSVIHYMREGSNSIPDIAYDIDDKFNEYIYKSFANITTLDTREDLYLDYLAKRWGPSNELVVGVFEDFRLLLENYRSASLTVSSNLVVNGNAVINSNLIARSLSIEQDFTFEGTLLSSNINVENLLSRDFAASNVHVKSNLEIDGNLIVHGQTTTLDTSVSISEQIVANNLGTGPSLIVRQSGANDIAHFFDDNVISMAILDGGKVGIRTSNALHDLHVEGDMYASTGLVTSNRVTAPLLRVTIPDATSVRDSTDIRYNTVSRSIETCLRPTDAWSLISYTNNTTDSSVLLVPHVSVSESNATYSVPLVLSNTATFHSTASFQSNVLLNAPAIFSATAPLNTYAPLTTYHTLHLQSNITQASGQLAQFANLSVVSQSAFGVTTFSSNVFFTPSSTLTLNGMMTTSNMDVSGALHVYGNQYIHSNLVWESGSVLQVTSNAVAIFRGATTFTSNALSHLSLETRTTVSGEMLLASNGSLHTEGPLTMNGQVQITSNATLNIDGSATLSSARFRSNVQFDKRVDVVGGADNLDDPIMAVSGTLAATLFHMSSDRRIKHNIVPIEPERALDIVRQLSVKKYCLNSDKKNRSIYGLIGQDVENTDGALTRRSRMFLPLKMVILCCDVTPERMFVWRYMTDASSAIFKCGEDISIDDVVHRVVSKDDEGFETTSEKEVCRPFISTIKGVYVDDFVTIDYSQIINLLISSVQVLANKL
jgi:hypothetical protein